MPADSDFFSTELSEFHAGGPPGPPMNFPDENDWGNLFHFAQTGKILAGAAHDINNQLMVAMSYMNLLLDSRRLETNDKQNAATVFDAVLYCTRLLNQTLNRVHQEPVVQECVSLVETLTHSIKMVMARRDFQHAGIRIIQNYDLSTPPVKGQPLQLKRVFINLIQNACLAILDSKTGDTVRIRLWHGDGQIHVEISDNGPGLPDFILQKRGGTSASGWKEHKGFGLGLMIVDQILKAHGGKMRLENLTEGGAKFHILLPAGEN